ncbi:IclR family transcriptional regulator [Neobacillus mesonae]|uniref:IclR family transcriptional regulator n=1 Tax=Neobacillus mesonae TaxID=1193713 RepID=UPI0008362A08|nr:IclR family transcriptional regulator [Neobacillus mesonae]
MDTEMRGQGIQSLELGINILIKIGEMDKSLSITEISDMCGISKSKLHRYLTSFCRTGFLQRDSSLQYSIGPALVAIGNNANIGQDIKDLAKPSLIKLRDLVNETVFLSVWAGDAPYPIDIEESRRQMTIGIKVGYKTSIVLTTTGRLFAAFLPEKEVQHYLHKDLLEHHMDPDEFQMELSSIREMGYSVADDILVPGLVAVSCPVFGSDNRIVATITIVGIKGVLDLSSDSQIITSLRKECMKLTDVLRSEQ